MTLPETIWAHAMHEALMERREVCATPRYLWKVFEHGRMRGFDFERDFPHDPDGLDDIDPVVLDMMRPTRGLKAGEIIVVGIPRYDSSNWARELFIREGVVLTESPPCSPFARLDDVTDRGLLLLDDGRVEEAREALRSMRFDDIRLDPVTYDLLARDESFDLNTILGPLPPEKPGRRYGPYDADPHTKGRRRRFRTQRRT